MITKIDLNTVFGAFRVDSDSEPAVGLRAGHLPRACRGGYLFLAPEPKDLAFLTLDRRQEAVARKLGFTP